VTQPNPIRGSTRPVSNSGGSRGQRGGRGQLPSVPLPPSYPLAKFWFCTSVLWAVQQKLNINRIKPIFTLLLCLNALYSNCIGADFMGPKGLELPQYGPISYVTDSLLVRPKPRGSWDMCPNNRLQFCVNGINFGS